MSDYQLDGDMPLFDRTSTIEKHEVPDTTEIAARLVQYLQPAGSAHSISGLRANFYDRVETIVHRLRQDKHVIDTVSGHYIYRHGPPIGWQRCHHSLQAKYLSTQHWRRCSFQRIEMDGCCTLCRRTRPQVKLNAHHWRYNLFKEDIQRDLQTYCTDCHADIHIVIKNSGVFFPKVLPAEVIERIENECS